jgi:hypothetical protein
MEACKVAFLDSLLTDSGDVMLSALRAGRRFPLEDSFLLEAESTPGP